MCISALRVSISLIQLNTITVTLTEAWILSCMKQKFFPLNRDTNVYFLSTSVIVHTTRSLMTSGQFFKKNCHLFEGNCKSARLTCSNQHLAFCSITRQNWNIYKVNIQGVFHLCSTVAKQLCTKAVSQFGLVLFLKTD